MAVLPRLGPAGPVQSFRLPNGLRVILAADPPAATASVWVWYRVGSKNEHPGITGIAHWVEHMMFNGSPRFPKGRIDRLILEAGGYLNAFTDVDFTAYLATVPRDAVELPLAIEADRMTRATMTEAEVERERSIVLSERHGNENWPEFRAAEELYELAFRHHPYRWDPLGFEADIRSMRAARLEEYYRRFYAPRNATLVVTGAFSTRRVRRQIREGFGELPRAGEAPDRAEREPVQRGERRARLRGVGTTPFLTIGFPAEAVSEPTTPATVLLDVLLGGETRLFAGSPWGRSEEHPTSRLYRGLVDTGLAVRAISEFRPREDPGLFEIQIQAAPGVAIERLEDRLRSELARLAREPPSPAELRDARAKIERAARLAYEGPTRTAFRLGYFALLGGRAVEQRLFEEVRRVSGRQLRSRAAELFRDAAWNIVEYRPTEVHARR